MKAKRNVLSKEEAEISETESKINELIQKKSQIDRMMPYEGRYLSLTGLGVVTLNDLNVRNYRFSDRDFSEFVEESDETHGELRSIAERGSFYAHDLQIDHPEIEPSQIWNVSIGLAKLQGDRGQTVQRFNFALALLQHQESTMENKMMAAEIMTASRMGPSGSSDNSDLQNMYGSFIELDRTVRRDANVPKQISAGVTSMVLFSRRYDGTYPIDRLVEFSKTTSSFESAAILSVTNVPADQLSDKFRSFRALFNAWGYDMSEDTELSSAYLAISDLGPDDVKTKLNILIDALKNHLEYPLVAAAILASIPTLEANETLDLIEKAASLLGSFVKGLERSELITLSVLMVHGIRNELVRELDPTAAITRSPSQLTYVPSSIFFVHYVPVMVAHSSFYSTYSGIGGAHPAHVHGLGGFMG